MPNDAATRSQSPEQQAEGASSEGLDGASVLPNADAKPAHSEEWQKFVGNPCRELICGVVMALDQYSLRVDRFSERINKSSVMREGLLEHFPVGRLEAIFNAHMDRLKQIGENLTSALAILEEPRRQPQMAEHLEALFSGNSRAELAAQVALLEHMPEGTDACIGMLKDPDDLRRAMAARMLGMLREPRAVGPLMAAYDDPTPEVENEVYYALHAFDTPEAKAFVTQVDEMGRCY